MKDFSLIAFAMKFNPKLALSHRITFPYGNTRIIDSDSFLFPSTNLLSTT